MSYSVELMGHVRRDISERSLSSHVIREVLKGLDDLAGDPDRRLIRVGPPHDALQYDLFIHEPTIPPRVFLFVFSVVYRADEKTVVIGHCEILDEEVAPG